ncbi:major facilitator superfamily domain-containing protein [Amylocarpus encephaloides]|uniref:Major facilitator superfamily domain-containing protein n=1 Tax=Amylocarpus encephaloides TaxID=45428 RepID=A0A9P7YT84_9HELO|nr:major facilitator superfamily domain-containing protein [Amylocarpus encephaloides]
MTSLAVADSTLEPTDFSVPTEDQGEEKAWKPDGWRFWAVFPGLCFSMLLTGLDASILATSLPTIVTELHGGALYVWTMNGYFLTTAAIQPLAGQAADIFGRRIPMILSLVFFAVGSGICGGANSLEMLIAGRLVQGLGGGALFVMVDTITADLVPLRERMKYMAIIMTFFTLGSFMGPIVGGAIVTGTSWRWVFYINLPVVGVALVFVILFLRVNHKREGTILQRISRVDFLGNVILVSSVVSILIPLTWGGTTYAWSSWRILVPLIIGFFGLVLFGLHQAYVAREPTTPLRIFANQACLLGYILTFLNGIILNWLNFFLPVYFQVLLEATPLMSGVDLLAIVIPLAPAGMVGGIIVAVTGRYKPIIIIGSILLCIGIGCLTLLDSNSSTAVWIILQIIVGAGGGLALTATLPAVQAPLPESDVAIATASWAFARSFGAIWGAAIPSAVFNSRFNDLLPRISDPMIRQLLANGGAYEHATKVFITALNSEPILKQQVVTVYTECLQRVWQILIAFAVVCVPMAVVLKEVVLRKGLKTEYGLETKEKGPENPPNSAAQQAEGI